MVTLNRNWVVNFTEVCTNLLRFRVLRFLCLRVGDLGVFMKVC